MTRSRCRTVLLSAASLLLAGSSVWAQAGSDPSSVVLNHRYANSDAQSLIGLPMGSHKTTVEKDGSLEWSQWSLRRRPLDSPIGFSSQMDGALAIEPSVVAGGGEAALKMESQTLYRGRYPFIVTKLKGGGTELEELAFAADPEQDPALLPTANSGSHALDLVRLTVRNVGPGPVTFRLRLSGRARNLPGHVEGESLVTHGGELIVAVAEVVGGNRRDETAAGSKAEEGSLSLVKDLSLTVRESRTIWLRLPYDFAASRKAELTPLSGEQLLARAVAQWDGIWARGARIHYPGQALNDFFDSSIATVLMLTEYDARGDLWTLDGPDVYRQYWGRGEYFQARAMEVAGQLSAARESVEHAFHIMNDDGEWDGPPVSGWPAWDNIGGNAGAVWDYYQYTRDRAWLARAYPYLLRSSEWVRDHREETTLEDVASVPVGARPIRRMLTGAKCRPEPEPELKPGEKTYWYGLLPWSYGDSGLPEGHSYSHNFLAAYGVRVTAEAARVLGKNEDATWLEREYGTFTGAIRTSVERSVGLEKSAVPYLPAQPTRPDAAYSQTFLAVWPTEIYSPNDPLVSGLLTRMESEETQGLPTNVAWAGPAGIWPGEAMNMSETYLLRDEVRKNEAMLLAALNHSYTTNVFKEEILTDVTKERACDTPHSKRENMQGTGDMPEAWGNANAVDLLRDMLVQERTEAPANTENRTTLHLLAGLPAEWVAKTGETVSVERTPTTLGTVVSLKLTRVSATTLRVEFDPGAREAETFVHVPLAGHTRLASGTLNGKDIPMSAMKLSQSGEQEIVAVGDVSRPVVLEFVLIGAGR